MIDIKSMTAEEIEDLIISWGYPKFRGKQIVSWLQKGVENFRDMKNLPKELVNKLSSLCYISVAFIEKKLVSRYDKTVKYLFRFKDMECVESVVMKYRYGYTICISTQVGCKMGCTFCATGRGGFKRNLLPGEMLSQIETAQKDLGIRIGNVVLMGMGEPLDNYSNVLKFLKIVKDENSLNIGMRHITLSTCGIVPKIYLLADENLQITLSISLHAPNDKDRSKTMPVNDVYSIEELIKACKYYIKKTGRRISFEYALIKDVNDSDQKAHELSLLLKDMLCHVNLIPVNEVKETGYIKSSIKRQQAFADILQKSGIPATIRRTLGSDINASCGQLRRKHIEGGE
ncbi:MAG: 23S rRNA (adenine(2503)-C(2))-methyltransferase RlmN [Acutalibacteraceae bacterium]